MIKTNKIDWKKIKWKRYISYFVVILFTLIFGTISLTSGIKRVTTSFFEKAAIYIILAVSLSLVIGFLGELSLGHAGFYCVGAYVGGKIAVLLAPTIGSKFVLLLIGIVVGGLASAVCGFLIGLPALKLKGDYLAIVTLAFGEIVRTIFMNSDFFGATNGLYTDDIMFNNKTLFIISFVIILIMLFVIQNLIRSKHGRAITAIRDSEIAAKATGINVTKYKLFVFALSAFFAGVAGVLFAFRNNPSYDLFSYNESINILVMVVLGGMGNINGSMVSAVLVTFLNVKLPTLAMFQGDKAVLKDVIYSLILILIVIYNNAPFFKKFRDKYNFKKLYHKIFRSKHDPSHILDDENKWDRVPTKIEMNEILSTDITVTESTTNPDKGGNE